MIPRSYGRLGSHASILENSNILGFYSCSSSPSSTSTISSSGQINNQQVNRNTLDVAIICLMDNKVVDGPKESVGHVDEFIHHPSLRLFHQLVGSSRLSTRPSAVTIEEFPVFSITEHVFVSVPSFPQVLDGLFLSSIVSSGTSHRSIVLASAIPQNISSGCISGQYGGVHRIPCLLSRSMFST